MSAMVADTLLVVLVSMFTTLGAEAIMYMTVYRTDAYKRLKVSLDKHSKQLERKKDAAGEHVRGGQKKKIDSLEERLKNVNREMSTIKMYSMIAISFTFMALMGMFNTVFDGRVVAKLPFVPISWFHGLSHRNLMGEDFTDCSFIFLYIICTMSIRQNLQKLLGVTPSRAANKLGGSMFSPPPSK
eukprot:scpid98397/ scgid12365/ Transmembrane and coiled-coil domain-containing protein 1; Transmembrane and coiled-coil domains protein 4; Xenogeneic cross-immune protein PCIA3 &gt; Transmembrane and coiled-coil domain-containing protein 1 &gt; Transmembrane and coiled-coil domains protein 1; Meg-2-like protein &gt; Transmembrane and coiled-coil domain-containing protein 1 &gt; Transmembrane and coiled-coil domain-containing protein 1 &gt; Transmembrane and coiled-coil domains protein 1